MRRPAVKPFVSKDNYKDKDPKTTPAIVLCLKMLQSQREAVTKELAVSQGISKAQRLQKAPGDTPKDPKTNSTTTNSFNSNTLKGKGP